MAFPSSVAPRPQGLSATPLRAEPTPAPSPGPAAAAPAFTPAPLPNRAATPSPSVAPASEATQTRTTGKVKGTLLIARMKFLRARGAAEAERVLKRLSSDDQGVLGAMLLPSSWYPAGLLLRLEMTAAAILSRGDRRALLREMGRFSADTNLAPEGVHRPFVREGEPGFLLENLPKLYGSQHSSGSRTCERTGPTSATVRHFDVGEAEPDDCLTTSGWLQRAIEISGGKNVTVEEYQCRGRGAPHCEFRITWQRS